MLTHELTPEADMDTYLARRLAPVRPLLSFGRSAKAYPRVPASVAVYSWWKDWLSVVTCCSPLRAVIIQRTGWRSSS